MPHRTIADTTLRNAKQMRSYMTKAEEALWQIVRAHRLGDLPFRRQTPIGPYIADFVCHSAKLIVEADGEHHAEAATANADRKRSNFLFQRGYKVLRFTNDEILEDRDRIASLILEAAQSRISPLPSQPSPARGEGSEARGASETPSPLAGEGKGGGQS